LKPDWAVYCWTGLLLRRPKPKRRGSRPLGPFGFAGRNKGEKEETGQQAEMQGELKENSFAFFIYIFFSKLIFQTLFKSF
jgi:hypothetical protein